MKNKKLSTGHAVSLLGLKSKSQMLSIADRIKRDKLSVRNCEDFVSKINQSINTKIRKAKKRKHKSIDTFENKLIHKYGTKVSISINKKQKGKITFEYYSKDDFDRILNILIK